MRFLISEETKWATACDNKKFSCLEGNGMDICKVLSCINGDVHFVLCSNKEFCIYQHKSGERVQCECPTRKEIFKKYKK